MTRGRFLTPKNNWLQKLVANRFLESEKKNNTNDIWGRYGSNVGLSKNVSEISVGPSETPLWAEISFTEGIFGPQNLDKILLSESPRDQNGSKKTRRVPKTSSGLIFAIFFYFWDLQKFLLLLAIFWNFWVVGFFFSKKSKFSNPSSSKTNLWIFSRLKYVLHT